MKDPADYWDDHCERLHEEEKNREAQEQSDYCLDMYTYDLEEAPSEY